MLRRFILNKIQFLSGLFSKRNSLDELCLNSFVLCLEHYHHIQEIFVSVAVGLFGLSATVNVDDDVDGDHY